MVLEPDLVGIVGLFCFLRKEHRRNYRDHKERRVASFCGFPGPSSEQRRALELLQAYMDHVRIMLTLL